MTPEAEATIRRLMLARNAAGVREVARREGIAKAELDAVLRKILDEQKRVGREDRLGERYDIYTGKYLSLEQWTEQLLRR